MRTKICLIALIFILSGCADPKPPKPPKDWGSAFIEKGVIIGPGYTSSSLNEILAFRDFARWNNWKCDTISGLINITSKRVKGAKLSCNGYKYSYLVYNEGRGDRIKPYRRN